MKRKKKKRKSLVKYPSIGKEIKSAMKSSDKLKI